MSTEDQIVDLRLGSQRTGTRTVNRMVWSVGVAKDFLAGFSETEQRVKLAQHNGQLVIQLSEDGILLSTSIKGRFAYANSVGQNHLSGLHTAEAEMPVQKLKGRFDPLKNQILITSRLPQLVSGAFVNIDQAKADADPQRHFPATHFTDEVGQQATSPQDPLDLMTVRGAQAWFNDRVELGRLAVHTEQSVLTPALAQVFINQNENNRPVRGAKLRQYIDDIVNDRWEFNGETIIVSREGLINNGQHRAYAVLNTNKSIPVLFVFGVDRDTRKTVDTGITRGPHDQLSADGFGQPTTAAALARFVLCYEANDCQSLANLNRVSGQGIYSRSIEDPLIAEASMFPYKYGGKAKRLAPPSVIAFCYYEFKKINEQQAKDFLEQVITGVNIAADSAAYVTREKLMNLSSLHREQKIELLFRGFKVFQKGKPTRGATIKVKWELPQL